MTKHNSIFKQLFRTALGMVAITLFLSSQNAFAQGIHDEFLPSIKFGEYGKIGFYAYGSLWGRYTDTNAGSTVQGEAVDNTFDVSIRRIRIGGFGHITKKLFLKFQMGTNNVNYINRNNQLRILDAYGKFELATWFKVGVGKSTMTGLSRYTSVSTSSMVTLDVPIFMLPNVNLSDDLTRRLGIFVEGQAAKFDYIFVMAKPFVVTSNHTLSEDATFYQGSPSWQPSAYVAYNFFDKESQTSTVATGTYLGSKKIMNLGAGFMFQSGTTKSIEAAGDTVKHDMLLWAVDYLLDIPLDANNTKSMTFYAGYFNYDFGPGYIRKIGVNNSANGMNSEGGYSSYGNRFATVGTGDILYGQFGYRFSTPKIKWMDGLMPYMAVQYGIYEKLDEAMILYDYGLNFLIKGHNSKVTIGIQHRPIFEYNTASELVNEGYKMMAVLQYQFRLKSK
ncbi:MAG: hypothetical protein JXR07_04560 [Reichenbachiella sp.]